ncbi:dipeptide ABC transporter ATP-binding protein [Microvirga sp. BT689]|uniref:ABC transporter ATP-binding protein n=1 Tax=Microvirga arvi TaxID=2778731 RepID=UPI001951E8BA|nr:dipeptide ABC transporter ATP-binding protein [Microvirga arvi]MBM6583180.1 dipeptide ABC transporter ATP-binding protein [Microvirga arvi]
MSERQPPLLSVENLTVRYPVKTGWLEPRRDVLAVNELSFEVRRGETLALVGESGCGKSTVGRSILRLLRPTSGRIVVDGIDIAGLSRKRLKPFRRKVQMIFQDPFASLNPRMNAGEIVGEPLSNFDLAHGRDREERVAALFQRVGLSRDQMRRYPHEFSGGQRQRLGIARALAVEPALIVGDEPLSALDVSVQAQVINLMQELQRDLGLAYVFIAHDLAVVQHISQRVAVMYLGRLVEMGDTRQIFANPRHPYTKALLAAVPIPDPTNRREIKPLQGEVPSPINPPAGCSFASRCPLAESQCRQSIPALVEVAAGQAVACHAMAHGH